MTMTAIEVTNFPPFSDGYDSVIRNGESYSRIGQDGEVAVFDTVQAANGKCRRWNRMLEDIGDTGFFYPVFEDGYEIEYVGDEFGWCSPLDCGKGIAERHWARRGTGHRIDGYDC